MKKLLLAIWVCLLLQSGLAAAQTIRLRLPDTTALVGSSFLLPVYVDSSLTGQNVLSYQIQLNYTSSHLLADSLVTSGTLSANANPIGNFGGSGVVTVAAATAMPLAGTGVLFYVRFRVISATGGYNSSVSFGTAANTFLNQGSPTLTFRNGSVNVPSLPFISVSVPTASIVVGDTIQTSASGGMPPYTWRLSDSTRGIIQSLSPSTARFIAANSGRTRIIAVDSNGFSGQSAQELEVHNFRMWTRDSSRLQGTQWLMPIYVGLLTPWNVLSGSFEIQLSNYPGLAVVGIERAGTLLAGVSQTFFAAQANNTWEVSFANATPITGSGILCYVRISVPNYSTSNFGYQVQLLNTLFNQNLTALTSSSSQTAVALPQISITPNTAELVAGESRQFAATNGFAPYRWSVSDSNLATISTSGLLTARQGGTIRVSARDTVGALGTSGNIVLYDTRVYIRDTVLITGDSLVDVAVFMDQLPQGKSVTAVSMSFDFNNSFISPLGVLQAGTASANWAGAANRIGTNRYSIALAGTTPQAAAGNLFFIRFRVLPGFGVNNITGLSNIQIMLNEGNPNLQLVNGQIRSLPCNPVATVTPSGNVTFCDNQPVQLTGSLGTAYQYQWSRNGSPIAGANSRFFTPTQSGQYTLQVSLNSTCFVVSDTVRVTINPSPIAQIRPYADTLNACAGDTVRLSAYFEPGYTLQWIRNGSTISGATDTVFLATQSGSYTIRATLNGCQTTSASQMVMIRALPTKPTITVTGSPVCAGDSATLRIPATTAVVQWIGSSGPIAGANDTVLRVPPGRYTVRLTNTFGCHVWADSVNVVPAIASAQIDPSGPTTFCQGGSVNLDLTQQTSYVRWFKNGIQLADTTRPLLVTTSGTYTANYRLIGNACVFGTSDIQVTVIPRPAVTFDSLPPVCANDPHFALSGGLPAGGTYVGPGVVNNRFYPASLMPGTYLLKYGYQQNGCSDTATRAITVLPLPGTTLAPQAPVCLSNAPFTLTGGLPLGGVYFGVGVASGDFNPALAGLGTHTIGYTTQNANGCRDTAFQAIVVNPLPVATIIQGQQASLCAGTSLVLNATPATGMSYVWLRNGAVVTGQTSASLTASQSGAYRVIVTNTSTQCFDTSAATTVTVNPLPGAAITAGGPTTFCAGGSVVLNATPATGMSYVWLRNGAVVTGQTTASLTANQSGAYRVIVTNTSTQCFDTSAVTTVTVNPLPGAAITAGGPTTFCQGGSVVLNATPATGMSYVWLRNGAVVTGQTTASLTANQSGAYRVIVTNTSTQCFDTSAATTVTVNPLPGAAITAGGPTTFCAGGSVVLNATPATGMSYVWLRNGAVVTGQTTASLTANQSGAYRVIVTNTSTQCFDTSAATTVTVNPLPGAAIAAAGPTTFCAGGSVVLNATPATGMSYVWLRDGAVVTGQTSASLTTNQSGAYRVIVTNTSTQCFDTSAATTVTVNPLPGAAIAAAGPTTFCAGGSVVLNATPATGMSYVWLRDGAAVTGQTSASLTTSQSGAYRVIVTNSSTQCFDTSAVTTVTVNPLPGAAIAAAGPTTFCQGGSVVLNATPATGMSYVWLRNGAVVTGQTTTSLTANQSGAYRVIVTNTSTQCFDTSAVTTVTVNPLPGAAITAGGPTTFCQGGSVVLNATPATGMSYVWLRNGAVVTGQTTASLTVTEPGIYRVVLTSGSGCVDTSSAISLSTQICGYVQGSLRYLNNSATPMTNTQVILLNQQQQSVAQTITNANGDFTFTNTGDGQFSLQFSTAKPWGGVNATDALATARHFVGMAPLTGLRLAAADVNASNNINTSDALLMARRFTGDISGFVTGDWVFERPVVLVNNDTAVVQVGALTYGDINGSYVPDVQLRLGKEVHINSSGYLKPDAFVWPIQVEQEMEVGAISLVMTLPEGVMVQKVQVPGASAAAQFNQNGRILHISWFGLDALQLKTGDELIQLHFSQTIDAGDFSLELLPGCELADAWAQPLQSVKLRAPHLAKEVAFGWDVSQFPNPFNDKMHVQLQLPEMGEVMIRMYDSRGKLVLNGPLQSFSTGSHLLSIEMDAFEDGMYQCEVLYTTHAHAHRKVLRLLKQH